MKAANKNVNITDLKPEMKEFIAHLELALGRELVITSGYRSPSHPIEAKKASPGEHSEGLAVDVACIQPISFLEVVGEAYKLGAKRIGVSRKSKFVHIGLSPDRPSSLWTY